MQGKSTQLRSFVSSKQSIIWSDIGAYRQEIYLENLGYLENFNLSTVNLYFGAVNSIKRM